MNIANSPLRFYRSMMLFISVLFLGNLFSIVSRMNYDDRILNSIGELFDFNTEANIPTLYSTLLILACALVLYYIYNVLDRDSSHRRGWLWLALVFVYLGIDETASLHERLIPLLREEFNLSGYLYYAWIIPYSFAVLILSFAMVPFLLSLPKRIQALFVISGIIFLSGSVGMELLGGQQASLAGEENYLYAFFYTVEELLEMVGMTTFLYALLTYIVQYKDSGQLIFKIK